MTPRASGWGQKRTEKQVERECDEIMALLGFVAIRFSQPRNTMQTPGIPDRKYYHPEYGFTLWFECKRPGGKQSPAQRKFQALAEACGEFYVLGGREALGRAVVHAPNNRRLHPRYIRLLEQLFPEQYSPLPSTPAPGASHG